MPVETQVGRYHLIRTLGQGGQAVVHEAVAADGRRVALKRLHPERLLKPGGRERFAREASTLAALDHPGLVRLLDSGEEGGVPFLVYELVEGALSFDDGMKGLHLRQRIERVRDAVRAVAALHARGIVHRDLSPENVLVEPGGRVRVADLGYSRAPGQSPLTRTGAVLGTPGWVAPEVVLGGSKDAATPAADVWSLGLLLWVAATGQHPFPGVPFTELLDRLHKDGPPSARAEEPEVSPALDAVCRRALSPRPEQRYPDAGALATALDAVLRTELDSSRWTPELRPGMVLEGRWRVLGRLGRGGMGTVLRARDEELGREVAIKLPLAGINEAQRRRFLREVELTASAHHRNLVRVHGGGVLASGQPFLVLELVEGGTPMEEALQDLPREGRLELLRQLASAVAHLHRRGIVHRDLKPENVLVDADGIARLLDLGLARAEGQEELTRSGTALGSPLYMAPEQVHTRRDRPLDARADVWALGVILYRALTGHPPIPHEGRPLQEILAMLLDRPPTPLREHARDVPAALEAVCLRALAKEPDQRQVDAAAFLAELEEALAAAAPARTGLLLVATTVLAMLAGAGGALALRPRQNPEDRPPPAVVTPEVALATSAAAEPLPVLPSRAESESHSPALPGQPYLIETLTPPERKARLRLVLADAERKAAQEPQVAAHQVARGQLLGEMGDHDGALAAYTRALDIDPRSVDALCARAFVRMGLKDEEGALADATRATELAPGEARTWYTRGGVQVGPGTAVEPGLRDLERAIALDPELVEAWGGLALGRMIVGDMLGCLEASNRVVELAPDKAMSWRNRSSARSRLGDAKGALSDLDRAIELEPEHIEQLAVRGTLRFDMGDREGARLDLDRAIELAPEDPRGWYALARFHDLSGDKKAALDALDSALRAVPNHLPSLLQRITMREQQGDLAGALADGETILRLAPEAPWRLQMETRVQSLRERAGAMRW